MAARKNKQPESTTAEARAFTIVLEEIRAQNKGFGDGQELLREGQELLREGQELLREGQEVLREGQEVLRGQMDLLRDQMRAGFAEVDRRFEQVDRRFDRVEQDVGLVKIAALDHARELKEIRAELGNKVDRHELETLVARGAR
jgi:hypothetical protein